MIVQINSDLKRFLCLAALTTLRVVTGLVVLLLVLAAVGVAWGGYELVQHHGKALAGGALAAIGLWIMVRSGVRVG